MNPRPLPRLPMRLISWNVNSIRTRGARVINLLQRHAPDVVGLQETKVEDPVFPRMFIEAEGYHVAPFGQKTYNGVAFLSKEKPVDLVKGFPGDPIPEHARVITGTFGNLRVINAYVVNGKDPADPYFQTKMQWLTAFRAFLETQREQFGDVLVMGDFNITPADLDSHDPERLRGTIHHHPDERAHLAALEAAGWTDLHRRVTQEQVFTWWDYRMMGFPQNRGLRIDLAYGTPSVANRVQAVTVDRDERKESAGEGKPSDHAPLLVDLAD